MSMKAELLIIQLCIMAGGLILLLTTFFVDNYYLDKVAIFILLLSACISPTVLVATDHHNSGPGIFV